MFRKPVTTLFLCLMWLTVCAGEYRTYGTSDGLGSRKVYQVEQDSTGFIWLYTQSGLERYDGAEFRRYSLNEQISSRDHIQSATQLCKDCSGTIWVALRNGKAYRYDSVLDRFDLKMDLPAQFGQDVRLYDIHPYPDGSIVAGCAEGLFIFKDGILSPVGLSGRTVEEISPSADGGLWIAADKSVFRFSDREMKLERLEGLPETQYITILDTGNELVLGTFSDGIYVYEHSDGSLTHQVNLPSVPVRSLVFSKDGFIFAGMDGAGIFKLDSECRESVEHFSTDNEEKRISGNTVSDICIDDNGSIWISTTTNGLCCIGPERYGAIWTKKDDIDGRSIDDEHINVIYRDPDGDFWYGSNKGLNLFKDGRWHHFLSGGKGNVVLAIAQDGNGDVWTGGFGMGLYRIRKNTGTVTKVDDSPLRYIYHIYPEKDKVWVGGLDGDFCSFDLRSREWESYSSDCIGDIWPSAAEDSLYLAGCSGFGIFDKKAKKFEWRREFEGFTLKYPIRALFCASDGTIWMATDGDGLVHLDPATDRSERYTTENGLTSDAIISVHEDIEGRIWFTTEEGLFWLDPERRTIISANDLLGIEGSIFNPNAAWLHPDGHLSFGTSQGILTFNPAELDYFNKVDIKLILNDLSLNYNSITADPESGPLRKCLDKTTYLELDNSSNSFSISFSRISFGNDFRVRYEHCLSGYDDHWMTTGASGTANYVKVSPGRYEFTLKATDKYSGEILAIKTLPLRIRPPWYRSSGAIAAYILILASISAVLQMTRRRRKAEKSIREKMHTFISVAHDLKTPVSLIKGPLEDLKKESGIPDEGRKFIDLASRNADRLMDMISQLLELRQIEGHTRLQLVRTDISVYLTKSIGEYRSAAGYKDIELSIDVSSDMPAVYIDTGKFDRILDNILSNAIKYTEKGAIDIIVRPEVGRWTIEIQDTGIGIPENEKKKIFTDSFRASNVRDKDGGGIGLMITRQIVLSHEGEIFFSSVEGKGTTFTVSFPFSYRHADIIQQEDNIGILRDNICRNDEMKIRSTILIVDDEPDMLTYLTDILSGEYDVLTAGNAAAALEMARQSNPDLIITDVVMPVMNGEELCRILKSNFETIHIPIILLSAANARQSIIFGLEAGANDYMTKPFDPSVLKARIRNLLMDRQRLRETLMTLDRSGDTPEPEWPSRMDKEFMDKVIAILERELSNQEFKIGDLCLEIAMSRTALYNKLKSLTGQGPNDFIRIFRLTRAKELLREKKHSIAEISDMVGFSDPKYFSVCFKKQFGESPSRI